MDNSTFGIRSTGDYATYRGHQYFAYRVRDHIRLFSDDDPPPADFRPSKRNWIRSEIFVPLTNIDHLESVRTTSSWHGFPFEVGVILGEFANVTYVGTDFDQAGRLPGMTRPDKYEVVGKVRVDELTDLKEEAVEVRFGSAVHDGTKSREQE